MPRWDVAGRYLRPVGSAEARLEEKDDGTRMRTNTMKTTMGLIHSWELPVIDAFMYTSIFHFLKSRIKILRNSSRTLNSEGSSTEENETR